MTQMVFQVHCADPAQGFLLDWWTSPWPFVRLRPPSLVNEISLRPDPKLHRSYFLGYRQVNAASG